MSKGRKPQGNRVGGQNLTDQETHFVKLYCKKGTKYFLNHYESGKKAYHGRASTGADLMKRPRVSMAIKNLLNNKDVDALLERGLVNSLKNPKDKNWQFAVNTILKIRGDYAPEKKVELSMSPDDLKEEMRETKNILKEVVYGRKEGKEGRVRELIEGFRSEDGGEVREEASGTGSELGSEVAGSSRESEE